MGFGGKNMAKGEILDIGDLLDNGFSGKGKKDFLSVKSVLNKTLIIERFDYDVDAMSGTPTVMIYTDLGIIKSGSGVLIKQAKDIERKMVGKKVRAKIMRKIGKSGKPYYTFANATE